MLSDTNLQTVLSALQILVLLSSQPYLASTMAESGDALWQKGESLLSGKKAFFGLGGAKYEEAAEKFKEAGPSELKSS